MNQVISERIPVDQDYNRNSDVGKISLAPTTVPRIHDQEVIPSDADVNMELGWPAGLDNALMHALVKRRNLDNYGKSIGT